MTETRGDLEQAERDGLDDLVEELDYYLAEEELWARAFHQYLASFPNALELGAELREQQEIGYHWSDDDFLPIMRVVAALFQELGWLKQRH